MDTSKLERLAESDYFDLVKELFKEVTDKLISKEYGSRIAGEVALEALSREKAVKIISEVVGVIERSVANRKEGERRSFK
jgi:hypothetical protein